MTTKKGDENLKGSASPHRSLYSISPHEKITKQTYNKLITDLNRSIKNQEVIELKFKTKINQEHQKERQKQTERLKRRKVNAEFLEKQIEEKNEKIKTGRIEAKRPGIPDDFNGYPNIFVTPLKEKRKQDRLRQAEFKKDLDKQLAYQNMLVLKKEREELDLENKIIENANSEYRLQKLIYDEKKRKHRELLLES